MNSHDTMADFIPAATVAHQEGSSPEGDEDYLNAPAATTVSSRHRYNPGATGAPIPELSANPDPPSQTDRSPRRGSMSEMEAKQRRESIKSIMTDQSLTPLERRKSIQFLMDGRPRRRDSIGSCYTTKTVDSPSYFDSGRDPGLNPGSSEGSIEVSSGKIGVKPSDSKHPYTASTTPVPAIAASASDPRFHHLHRQGRDTAAELQASKRAELSRPACEHYRRNCSIVASCCGATYGCRICHDDCPVLPPVIDEMGVKPNEDGHRGGGSNRGAGSGSGSKNGSQRSSSMPTSFASFHEPEHHLIDRFAIREVICRCCYTRQSSKT